MENTRTKTIFWVSVSVLCVVLTAVVTLAMEFLGLALGHRDWGRHSGAAAFPCMILSVAAVTALYRRLGLVEPERTESLRRATDTGPMVLEAPVEIRTQRGLWLAMALTMDVFSISIFVLVRTLPVVPGTEPWGYATAAFFAMFSLGAWYGYATGAGLTARVDREGVRGDGAGPKSSARWSEIAACEITAVPMPWGQFTRYTFQDAEGRTLMRLMLTADGAEQGRFQDALRECFG